MSVTLVCYWRNKETRGHLQTTIETTVSMKDLKACQWVANRLEFSSWWITAQDRGSCLDQLMIGVRAVHFMQATGFRQSKARSLTRRVQSGFWLYNHDLRGLDHYLYWLAPDGSLIMSNEPYVTFDVGPWDPFAQVRLPKGIGIWYPPATTLFLLTKTEHRASIEIAREKLLAAGPAPMPDIKVYESVVSVATVQK